MILPLLKVMSADYADYTEEKAESKRQLAVSDVLCVLPSAYCLLLFVLCNLCNLRITIRAEER